MTIFWRSLFFLLVLGNLLFFAWSQGHFGRIDDGREPQRYGHQLTPDKLRVSRLDEAPAAPPATDICRVVGGLKLADARQLEEKAHAEEAANVANGLRFAVKPVEMPPGHWVHIPPLDNKAAVDKKLLELKQRGVADAEPLLAEGADRFAISFGMFDTAEAAAAHLQALTKRGVRSAIIQTRERPAEKAQLEAHGPQETLLKRLPELLSSLGAASTTLEECPNEKQP